MFFLGKIRAILGDRAEAIAYLKRAVVEGFLMLQFFDYHRRPHMGLHSLDLDKDFQAVRDELAKKIDQVRAHY
jgi:hypothetical protein